MLFHIARNGQTFGPYTEEDVRRYLASGNILPTDLAQAQGTEDWLPVAELFPVAQAPGYPPTDPYAGGLPRLYPNPPDLPWWVVLLLTIVTGGLFSEIWGVVQSGWLRKINAASVAVYLYLASLLIFLFRLPSIFHSFHHSVFGSGYVHHSHWGLGALGFVFAIVTRFIFRSELLKHFNGPEPVGLRLSGAMTFFFGVVYFQYHFNRINDMKRALGLSFAG